MSRSTSPSRQREPGPGEQLRHVDRAFRILYPRRRLVVDPGWFRKLQRRAKREPTRMGIAVAQVVGNNTQYNATGATSVAVTLTVSAGSMLAVWGQWGTTTTSQTPPVSISDTQGGTYYDGQYLQFTSITQSGVKFFRLNTSAGSLTVTLTLPTAPFNALYVAEITGAAGIVDATNANAITTASTATDGMSCGPMINTYGPALTIGYCSSLNGVAQPSLGTGFTSQLVDTTTFSLIESKRVTTTGTDISPTFTTSTGTNYDGYLAGYVFLEATPTQVYPSQLVKSENSASSTTITVTLNVTAGSFLVVYVNSDFQTSLTITVSDPTNGTYSNADTVHETVAGVLMQQSWVKNTASGSLTITATFSSSTTSRCITVREVINATGSAPDTHTSNYQNPAVTTTNGTTSGSVTASAGGLLLALCAFQATSSTLVGTVPGNPGTGFTSGVNVWANQASALSAVPEHALVNSGSNAATYTASTNATVTVTFLMIFDGPTGLGPTINTQPSSTSIMLGNTATFSVTATATAGSLSYQWQKNGSNISGATSSSYTTPVLLFSDNQANFDCVVTDSNGSATTALAYVTITPPIPHFVPPLIFLAFAGSGGANHYTAALSETVSVSESRTTLFAAKVTGLAESESLSESRTTTYRAHPSLSESESTSEAIAEKFAAKPALAETISVSEAEATKFGARVAGLAESETLSESAVELFQQRAQLAESEAVTESIAEVFRADQALSESEAVSEAAAISHGMRVGLAESEALTEAETTRLGAVVPLAETVSISETIGEKMAAIARLSESISAVEALVVILGKRVSLSESASIAESLVSRFAAHQALAETDNVAEAFSVSRGMVQLLSDAVVSVELLSEVYRARATLSETVTTQEAFTGPGQVSVSEAVTVVEALAVKLRQAVALAEAVTSTDAITAEARLLVGLAETAALTEASSFRARAAADLSETVAMTEAVSSEASFRATFAEALTIAEAILAKPGGPVRLSETIALAEALTITVVIAKLFSAEFGATAAELANAGRTSTQLARATSVIVSQSEATTVVLVESRTGVIFDA